MSKSLGNYIGVTDPPAGQSGMFGKIMSLPDGLLESYYALVTDLPLAECRATILASPRDAKIHLAKQVISWLHSAEAAEAAEAEFKRLFVEKDKNAVPDDIPEIPVGSAPQKLAPVLVKAGLASSNGEAVRKMKEGAVHLDGEKVTDFHREYTFDKPAVVRLGRKFARIMP